MASLFHDAAPADLQALLLGEPMTVAGKRCNHQWRIVGPADDFGGAKCVTWRCDRCSKEHVTFDNCEPASGKKIRETS
jgi:hypothetical protein